MSRITGINDIARQLKYDFYCMSIDRYNVFIENQVQLNMNTIAQRLGDNVSNTVVLVLPKLQEHQYPMPSEFANAVLLIPIVSEGGISSADLFRNSTLTRFYDLFNNPNPDISTPALLNQYRKQNFGATLSFYIPEIPNFKFNGFTRGDNVMGFAMGQDTFQTVIPPDGVVYGKASLNYISFISTLSVSSADTDIFPTQSDIDKFCDKYLNRFVNNITLDYEINPIYIPSDVVLYPVSGDGGATALSHLTDVDVFPNGPSIPISDRSILMYSTTHSKWISTYKNMDLSDLGDVVISAPVSDRSILMYDVANSKWISTYRDIKLNDLGDVSTNGTWPVRSVLAWDGSQWVPATPTSITNLADVSTTTNPPALPQNRLLSLGFNPNATDPTKPYELQLVYQSHQFKLRIPFKVPALGEFCFQDPIFSATNTIRISYTSNALSFDNLWFQEEFAPNEQRYMVINGGEFTYRFKVTAIAFSPLPPDAYLTFTVDLVETVGNTILTDDILCEFTSEPIIPTVPPDATTASNLGTVGGEVFSAKVGDDLRFRRVAQGGGVAVTQNTEQVIVSLNATIDDLTGVDLTAPVTTGQLLAYDGTKWTNSSPPAKEVLEFADITAFPTEGTVETIYVAEDDNKIYRFDYVQPFPPPPFPPISAPTIDFGALAPNYTVSDYSTLVAAITTASNGEVIYLLDGDYLIPASTTLTVAKQLTLYGQSQAGVVIRTAGVSTDPTKMIFLNHPHIQMGRMTVSHRTPNNISVEVAIDVAHSGVIFDSMMIEYTEFGITMNGDNWSIVNSTMMYRDSTRPTNSVRALAVYRFVGENNFCENCQFTATFNGATAVRCIFFLATNPQSGVVWIRNNTFGTPTRPIQQAVFFEGINTGRIIPVVTGNTSYETSVFVGIFSTVNNILDLLGEVQAVITDNTLTGSHSGAGSTTTKGVLTIDGAGTLSLIASGSTDRIWCFNNTITVATSFRADFAGVVGTPPAFPLVSGLLQFGYKSSVFTTNANNGSVNFGGFSYPTYIELSPSTGAYVGGIEPNATGANLEPTTATSNILSGVGTVILNGQVVGGGEQKTRLWFNSVASAPYQWQLLSNAVEMYPTLSALAPPTSADFVPNQMVFVMRDTNKIYRYDTVTSTYVELSVPPSLALEDLTNVLPNPATDGQVLTYLTALNSWAAVSPTPPVPATSLNDLTDVVLTTPATGNGLIYNGTNFVNAIPDLPLFASFPGGVALSSSVTGTHWGTFSVPLTATYSKIALWPIVGHPTAGTRVAIYDGIPTGGAATVLLRETNTLTSTTAMEEAELTFTAPLTLTRGRAYSFAVSTQIGATWGLSSGVSSTAFGRWAATYYGGTGFPADLSGVVWTAATGSRWMSVLRG